MDTNWIEEKTISELQEKLEKKQVTSRDLVLTYLQRIAEIDASGPSLHSIIEVNPDALFLADTLDKERSEGEIRGPLHGIPIVVKDNIDTKDKMHTTAGSLVLKNHFAKEDAFLVKQLRDAGAILLAKANLTEWANFITQGMPTGYSSLGGQTINPYGKEFMVGGSSAGTGASVAANLAVAGIGTETSGSILSPASQNGLVGIKPTVGLISRSGVIPISSTQDTPGPMTRTVEDAASLLTVLQGVDEKDLVTGSNPLLSKDFMNFLDKEGLKGKRIGVLRLPYFGYVEEEKQRIVDLAISDIEALGATIVEGVHIPTQEHQWSIDVMLYEFKAAIEHYLNSVDDPNLVTLNDLIHANRAIGSRALKYGQTLFMRAEATSGKLTDPEYLRALVHDQHYAGAQGIDALMEQEELDLLLSINNVGAALPAKAGYPSITVPAGQTKAGEPVGVTFTAGAYSEPTLISCAYSYEQATHHRRKPSFN